MQLADRLNQIKPSATVMISGKAKAMKAQGIDVIGLSAGEPDFDTPDYIKAAANKAIEKGQTKYTAVDGTAELKKAIITKLKRDNQLDYKADQIIASNGAKQSLMNAMLALLNPGDEVLIPAPYWVSYPDMAKIAQANPVIIPSSAESNLKITAQQLEQYITPKTKLFIMNSPCNPSGQYYSKEELRALADVLVKHPNIYILTDDIYEHIYWGDEPFANILNAAPELEGRTVIINGVAKAYAMTGWRIGFAAGPAPIVTAMRKLQSQMTSCPCSISQAAAAAAFESDTQLLKPMVDAFVKRQKLVVERIKAIPGMSYQPGPGAFYALVDCRELINQMPDIADDLALSEHILEQGKVAVVPGGAFGANGFIRLSYATSEDDLNAAFDRIAEVCQITSHS